MLDLLYILEYDSDPLKAELSIKTSAEFLYLMVIKTFCFSSIFDFVECETGCMFKKSCSYLTNVSLLWLKFEWATDQNHVIMVISDYKCGIFVYNMTQVLFIPGFKGCVTLK